MEDAATAEISRTQIWHWLHHGAALDDGRCVTQELVTHLLDQEMERVAEAVGREAFAGGRFPQAIDLFLRVATTPELEEFLTLPAYDALCALHDPSTLSTSETPVPRR